MSSPVFRRNVEEGKQPKEQITRNFAKVIIHEWDQPQHLY